MAALARFALVRFAPNSDVLSIQVWLRSAPVRFAPFRFASSRFAQDRSAPWQFGAHDGVSPRSALYSIASRRLARLKSTFLRSACPDRLTPVRSLPAQLLASTQEATPQRLTSAPAGTRDRRTSHRPPASSSSNGLPAGAPNHRKPTSSMAPARADRTDWTAHPPARATGRPAANPVACADAAVTGPASVPAGRNAGRRNTAEALFRFAVASGRAVRDADSRARGATTRGPAALPAAARGEPDGPCETAAD